MHIQPRKNGIGRFNARRVSVITCEARQAPHIGQGGLRNLKFQPDQILHSLAHPFRRQLRVLGDLEVAGEAAPHFAVALALVLLRQHADLGVDQCLELRLLRRGEGVGGRQGSFPLALQLGFQRVEGFDVGQLEAHGLGACIAHHQESEAVLEDDEHG